MWRHVWAISLARPAHGAARIIHHNLAAKRPSANHRHQYDAAIARRAAKYSISALMKSGIAVYAAIGIDL